MKKIITAFFLIVASIIPGSAFEIPKPSATIKNFDIDSISLRDITFLFDVAVKNPYPVDLKLEAVKMKFSIEGKQFFDTETSKNFKIRAKGEASNIFTVTLKYQDIINIVKDYSKKDYLNTVIDTEIVVPTPKSVQGFSIPKSFSFKYTLKKRIPAIKPEISVANFAVETPSLEDVTDALKKSGRQNIDIKKARDMFSDIIAGKKPEKIIDPASIDMKLKVNFDIVLKNDTRAPLDFKDLGYDFLIDGSPLINGKTSQITRSGASQILRVSNSFSTKSLAGPITAALKNRKGAFSVKGATFIKLPDDIKKEPVKLSFDEGGAFNIK